MSLGHAFYSHASQCWYLPVASVIFEKLQQGPITVPGPVRLEYKSGALHITELLKERAKMPKHDLTQQMSLSDARQIVGQVVENPSGAGSDDFTSSPELISSGALAVAVATILVRTGRL